MENKTPANDTKGHPLVPKLDFRKITFDEETSNEATPHYSVPWDIDDEEGVQNSNQKYFFDGSQINTTHKRSESLEKRKQLIINILYKQCAEKGQVSGQQLEEFLNTN